MKLEVKMTVNRFARFLRLTWRSCIILTLHSLTEKFLFAFQNDLIFEFGRRTPFLTCKVFLQIFDFEFDDLFLTRY